MVWLDELQRYLDGEHGLTGGVVQVLLDARHPAVIIGTLWPDWYAAYTAGPASGSADPHAREPQVLDLANLVRIDARFSAAEQARARAAAARDPTAADRLGTAGFGFTRTWRPRRNWSPAGKSPRSLARTDGRCLPRRWMRPGSVPAPPLSTDFLRAAAIGYCTPRQQAEAPDDWFEQALAYATKTARCRRPP